jgi:alkaline phosphatase D
MINELNRRQLVQLGAFGLGALAIPSIARASFGTGFTHNVASGEPAQNSVLLWTRFVGSGDTALKAEVSEASDFRKIIGGGDVVASPARDFTAKVKISGLRADSWYFYRFVAPDGSASPVGRTRTLPEGGNAPFKLGVFSCSNMPFGYFNAYAHAVETGDLDLAVHLGDYLYEYQRGVFPSEKDAIASRIIEPAGEIIALADYRLRYASYRLDPDLQKLHQLCPMIAMWDDHEFTNDGYQDGAQNHNAGEGDWSVRKLAAEQAWREWMPVKDLDAGEDRWSRYEVGDLATIHMTESRISARSKQPNIGSVLRGAENRAKALDDFRDSAWQDPSREMLGRKQEAWLANGFKASKSKWNIWAQQTIVGATRQPADALTWLKDETPEFVKQRVALGAELARADLPTNMDSWDGYPAARSRVLQAAQNANADLVVLTGDSHNAWAFELDHDSQPVGVELAGHSITSPGFEYYLNGRPPADIAKMLVETNRQLDWMDASQRGYMTVTMTDREVISDWQFMNDIKTQNRAVAGSKQKRVLKGAKVFSK